MQGKLTQKLLESIDEETSPFEIGSEFRASCESEIFSEVGCAFENCPGSVASEFARGIAESRVVVGWRCLSNAIPKTLDLSGAGQLALFLLSVDRPECDALLDDLFRLFESSRSDAEKDRLSFAIRVIWKNGHWISATHQHSVAKILSSGGLTDYSALNLRELTGS